MENSESGNWLQCMGLLRRGARCRDRLRRGAWCSLLCKGAWCRVWLRLRRGAWCGWLNEEITDGTGALHRGAMRRDRLRRGEWCGLLHKGARCRVRLRRGSGCGWLNEELTSVALGPLNFVSCFWFGSSIGRVTTLIRAVWSWDCWSDRVASGRSRRRLSRQSSFSAFRLRCCNFGGDSWGECWCWE